MDETTKLLLTSGLTLLTSIVVAVTTAILTVRLSLGRFRSERWWERKVEVYSRLLDLLFDLQEFAASQLRLDEPTEEKLREFETRSANASAELRKIRTIGAFVISKEVWTYLRDMDNDRFMNLNNKDQSQYDTIDNDELTLSVYIGKIRDQIRKELKVSD